MSQTPDTDGEPKGSDEMAIIEFRQMFSQGKSFSGRERHCAFLNTPHGKAGAGSFANISSVSGFDFPDDGRAIGLTDWDDDGDIDMWLVNRNAPQLRFLRNDIPTDNRYLTLRLVGNGTTSPRDAIGSRVTVTPAGSTRPFHASLRAGQGFLAQSTKTVLLGLGDTTTIREVVVRWPDGNRETFSNLEVDRRYRIVQGEGQATELPSRKSQGNALKLTPSQQSPPPPDTTAKTPCLALLDLPNLLYLERPFSSQQLIKKGHGKSVLVNMWSSSCLPCIKELKAFSDREEDLRAAGIEVLALSVDSIKGNQDEVDAAQEVMARLKLSSKTGPFTTGFADWKLLFQLQSIHNSISASGRLLPVPTSFLIDGEGRLSVIYKGPVGVDEIIADLEHAKRPLVERFDRQFAFGGHAVPHERTTEVVNDAVTNSIFRLAQEFEASQRNRSASKLYRQLLERSPNDVVVLYSLGNLLLMEEKFDEGIPHLERVIELDPGFGLAYLRLGGVRFFQGQTDVALPYLERAIELLQDNHQAHAILAMTYEKLNRREEAITQFEEALRIAPKDPRSRDAIKRLKHQK